MTGFSLMAEEDSSNVRVLPYSLDEAGSIGVTTVPGANALRISNVLPGSPAEDANLKQGDLITHINKKTLQGLKPEDCVDLLRGKTGTKVVLAISRSAPKSELTVTLERVPLTRFLTKKSISDCNVASELKRVVKDYPFVSSDGTWNGSSSSPTLRTGEVYAVFSCPSNLTQKQLAKVVADIRDHFHAIYSAKGDENGTFKSGGSDEDPVRDTAYIRSYFETTNLENNTLRFTVTGIPLRKNQFGILLNYAETK